MSGSIIETLRRSPILSGVVCGEEFESLANCGARCRYLRGETILDSAGHDERMFVLSKGAVRLHIEMQSDGCQCGGDVFIELGIPGECFGWEAWVRPERIAVEAVALEAVSVAALDLHRLRAPKVDWRLRMRMLQILYGLLQEYGLCPPNVAALLAFGEVARPEKA